MYSNTPPVGWSNDNYRLEALPNGTLEFPVSSVSESQNMSTQLILSSTCLVTKAPCPRQFLNHITTTRNLFEGRASMYKNWLNFARKKKDFLEFYMEVCKTCKRRIKILIGKILERLRLFKS